VIEFCYLCDEFPCKRYDGADAHDSFISHKNQFRDLDKAKRLGIEPYAAELNEKVKMLEHLLEHCNDGRRKAFFCAAVNLLEMEDVKSVMASIANVIGQESTRKERADAAARLFEEAADKRGISLKLRKKQDTND
jgi:hypothetical protein